MEIIFVYNREKFKFKVDRTIDKGGENAVHFGYFGDKAPGNLAVGEKNLYCLKVVKAEDPAEERCPACRECYDLIPFQGEHLRKVLLQSDESRKVTERLDNGKRIGQPVFCMNIEPYYYSLKDFFTNCGNYKVTTRLDIVRQFALGSQELGQSGNQINGQSVLAHRDLKWQNGVAELVDGKYCVRLVDFATIWLRDMTRETDTQRRSVTQKGLVSPENSSPESLLKQFSVSEKTDVYALGMMLASLFMLCNGKYVNPLELWVKENGWAEDVPIAKSMNRCLEAYEKQHDLERSWIEKDLKKTVTWEQMQSERVGRDIRRLFCAATHIDPARRISREEFIQWLERIAAEADAEDRQPVSLYLFNGTNADRYRVGYQLEAAKLFQQEAQEAQRYGSLKPQALYIRYTNPGTGKTINDCLYGRSEYPSSTEADFLRRIGDLESGREAEKDLLLFGIYAAADFLSKHADRFYFTGKVYLFTPRIPRDDEMKLFAAKDGTLDLQELCSRTLDRLSGKETEFLAIAGEEPTDSEVKNQWNYRVVRKSPPPPGGNQKKVEEARAERFSCGYVFDVGPTAPYIALPDGKTVYVGIINSADG